MSVVAVLDKVHRSMVGLCILEICWVAPCKARGALFPFSGDDEKDRAAGFVKLFGIEETLKRRTFP